MGDKYPLLPPEKIIAVLIKFGFVFKSQKGSHAKYTDGTRIIIIPMHNEVARGTLKSILMQANIELGCFLKSLNGE